MRKGMYLTVRALFFWGMVSRQGSAIDELDIADDGRFLAPK